MSEQRPFKVGDDVFCLVYGHGKVESVSHHPHRYPISARGKAWHQSYSSDGCHTIGFSRTLYHANSGIIKIDTTLRPELEVDAKIWVREREEHKWAPRHFKLWDGSCVRCFKNGATSHSCGEGGDTWKFYTLTDPNGEQD